MLEEAFRVVRPGGQLAVFEGDYATVTVALGAHDPLQACVDAMVDSSVTDRWIVRRLTALVAACGFEDSSFRSFGYGEPGRGDYMLTIVDRGADILCSRGEIGERTAAGLKEGSPHSSEIYLIEGVVELAPASRGRQSVRIDWRVYSPDGGTLGGVSQTKLVRRGSLDKSWGKAADAAASAAAQGIAKLIPH